MIRKRLPVVLVLLLANIAAAGSALAGKGSKASKGRASQAKFVGVHPIARAHGGGLCHIEAPHVHVYAPADVKVQYRVHDDHYYFIGDPVAYGWEGPRHTYYGHHPVNVDVVLGDDDDDDDDQVEYCYLDGSHFHAYRPAPQLEFEVHADAYLYVGDVPDSYVAARVELDPIDVVYEPIVYDRPVVVIESPPPAWIGVRFAVVAPSVHVVAPVARPRARGHVHADVEVVAPSLSIEIGVPSIVVGGGIYVEGHGHGHFKGKKHKHKGHKRGRGRHRGHGDD